MRYRQAWAFCLFSASLLIACSSPPQLSYLASDATILAFGDSLTYGTGAKPATSYPRVLAELTGRSVINAGIPGETSAQGLKRLPKVLHTTRPDLVILCLGGNDFLRRQDINDTRANLAAMIELIKAEDIPLVLLAVPQPRLLLSDEPLYAELAEHYNIPLGGEIITRVLGNRSLKSDAVHPNAAGYRRIAVGLTALLNDSGAL